MGLSNILQSEWDPVLTPGLKEYLLIRLNGDVLEIKTARSPSATLHIDAKAIPQIISILTRLKQS